MNTRKIKIDDNEVSVERLGLNIARVVDPGLSQKVSKNDFVGLTYDPSKKKPGRMWTKILIRKNHIAHFENMEIPPCAEIDDVKPPPIFVPHFVWDDGEIRPLNGFTCGPLHIGELPEELSMGVLTPEGHYFCVTTDERVECAVPQFWMDEEPYYSPIVSIWTIGGAGTINPITANFNPHPEAAQDIGAALVSSADKRSSAKSKRAARAKKPRKGGKK